MGGNKVVDAFYRPRGIYLRQRGLNASRLFAPICCYRNCYPKASSMIPGSVANGLCSVCIVGQPLLLRCLQSLLGVRALTHCTSIVILFELILRSIASERRRFRAMMVQAFAVVILCNRLIFSEVRFISLLDSTGLPILRNLAQNML